MHQTNTPIYIVGISTIAENNPEGFKKIGELWQNFFNTPIKEKLNNIISDNIFCAYSDYENGYKGKYKTTLGYKVNNIDFIPAEFTIVTIPAGNYEKYISKSNSAEDTLVAWQKIWALDPEKYPRTFIADFQEHTEKEVLIYIGYQ
jgi:predicted transcriptional regulator YdeE